MRVWDVYNHKEINHFKWTTFDVNYIKVNEENNKYLFKKKYSFENLHSRIICVPQKSPQTTRNNVWSENLLIDKNVAMRRNSCRILIWTLNVWN